MGETQLCLFVEQTFVPPLVGRDARLEGPPAACPTADLGGPSGERHEQTAETGHRCGGVLPAGAPALCPNLVHVGPGPRGSKAAARGARPTADPV